MFGGLFIDISTSMFHRLSGLRSNNPLTPFFKGESFGKGDY